MTSRHHERRRTCLAYSPGGHAAELRRALTRISFADAFHITFDDGQPRPTDGARCYHVCHPRRSLLRTLLNAVQTAAILLRERPRLVISTGADVAVASVVLGKMLGAEVVFIETGGTLAPSLAGRLAYPFADLFIVPWPEKLRAFPRALLARGPLL